MAKNTVAKVRKVSKRSRAAKRASSPSVDVDKSLSSLGRPESPSSNNPTGQSYNVLGAQGNNGISKKKNNKKETRNQRLRREKGLERAEANSDIVQTKRGKSIVKAQVIKERSRNWDDIDGSKADKKNKSKSAFDGLPDEMDEDSWEDEPDEVQGVANAKSTVGAKNASKVADEVTMDAEDDEIT